MSEKMTPRSLSSTTSSLSSYNSLKTPNGAPEQKSPYNSITHSVRRVIPQEMACIIGCRGRKCKYDSSNWPPEQMAIKGIYSHWYYLKYSI